MQWFHKTAETDLVGHSGRVSDKTDLVGHAGRVSDEAGEIQPQKTCEEAETCSGPFHHTVTAAETGLKLALDAAAWLQPLAT